MWTAIRVRQTLDVVGQPLELRRLGPARRSACPTKAAFLLFDDAQTDARIRNIVLQEKPRRESTGRVPVVASLLAVSGSLMTAETIYRQPLHILCADDNQELVELVSDMLRFYGYGVECAYDGVQALELIAANPDKFDLLITDFEMPRVDGHDLVVKARAAGFRGKVIVFSGALSLHDRQRFGDLAVEAIVDKPAEHRQLISVVARLQTELWERANADAA